MPDKDNNSGIERVQAKRLKSLGDDAFNQGKYLEAIDFYDKATDLDPNYLAAWNNMGYAYHKLGQKDDANWCKETINEIKANIEKQKEFDPTRKRQNFGMAKSDEDLGTVREFNFKSIVTVIGGIFLFIVILAVIASFVFGMIGTPNVKTSGITTVTPGDILKMKTNDAIFIQITEISENQVGEEYTYRYLEKNEQGQWVIKKNQATGVYGLHSPQAIRENCIVVDHIPLSRSLPVQSIPLPTTVKITQTVNKPTTAVQDPDTEFLKQYYKSQMNIENALDRLNGQNYSSLITTAERDYYLLLGMPVTNSLYSVKSYYLGSLQDFATAGRLFEQGNKEIQSGSGLTGSTLLHQAGSYLNSAVYKKGYSEAYLQEYKSNN